MAHEDKPKGGHSMKLVLFAGALILLILLITPGAAAPGTTTVMAVQQAVVADVVAVGGGGGINIPRRSRARSPYVPPTWVPYAGPARGPRGGAPRR